MLYRLNLERKGHRPFVLAARELPDVRFVLAGRWDDDAIDVLRADAPENVLFTGYLEDEELDAWFRRAAVYAQPSLHEGFGLSLAEAMLAGAVPVVTKAGALPEVVGDVGRDDRRADARRGRGGHQARARAGALRGRPRPRTGARAFPLRGAPRRVCAEVEAALRARRDDS